MTSLVTYTPGRDADLLLAQLWARMDADGDLDLVFGSPTFGLSDLMVAMRAPRELLYAADDDGIWFAAWYEPFMQGAHMGFYARPDKRSNIAAGSLFLRCLRAGVTAYKTIIGVTRRMELLEVLQAVGYRLVGHVPELYHGHDAFLAICNTETLERRQQWAESSKHSRADRQRAERAVRPAQPVEQVAHSPVAQDRLPVELAHSPRVQQLAELAALVLAQR